MCGCGKSKVAVTSVELAAQEQATRNAQDVSTTVLMRERAAAERASVVAALQNASS